MDLEELRDALRNRSEHGWRMPGLDPVSIDGGHVVMRVEVTGDHVNRATNFHGGAGATLVDIAGTIAISNADPHHRVGVSTDMSLSWLAPIPLGDTAVASAQVLKVGRTMAFVAVDIRRASDDTLCVQGRMTKSLGPVAE